MEIRNLFAAECHEEVLAQGQNKLLKAKSAEWLSLSLPYKYSYHFSALGRPIIQYPQDIVALQELIWAVRPDLIVETGIAHGGSLILSASVLALLDFCEAAETGTTLDPRKSKRRVLGIDIDVREHNRLAIEAHPLSHRIDMIEGSSISTDVISQVYGAARKAERVMVILDSNHTHEHVLAELEAFAPLTSPGSYCVVFDTVVEDLPDSMFENRPWSKGNSPKTAVFEYLRTLESEGRRALDGDQLHLAVDDFIESKLLITVAPSGYLKRV